MSLYDCELVNIRTGEVNRRESLSNYAMKRKNNHLALIDSDYRWRRISDEQSK